MEFAQGILEIPLRLRIGKLLFFVLAFSLLLLVIVAFGPGLFESGFDWKMGLGLVIFAIGLGFVFKSVFDAVTMCKPMLLVASKEGKIVFYTRSNKGISNASGEIELAEMQRFYIVKTYSRFVFHDISFAFVPRQGFLRTTVDPLPELFEIPKQQQPRILDFVAQMDPEISIGYDGGIIAQAFKK